MVTNYAQIAFGFAYPTKVTDFPWLEHNQTNDSPVYAGGVVAWWRAVNHCPIAQQGLANAGQHRDFQAEVTRYAQQETWDRMNPVPLVSIETWSDRVPRYLLAIPGTHIKTSTELLEFNPEELVVSGEQLERFMSVFALYNIPLPDGQAQPRWWLTTYRSIGE